MSKTAIAYLSLSLPLSCRTTKDSLTRREDIWRALEHAIVLPTEGHVLCIQLFGTSDFW